MFKENGNFQRIFEIFTGHLQHSWGYLKQKTNTAKKTLSCFLIMPTLGLTVFLEKPSRMTGFFLVSHYFLLFVNFFYWVISITTRKQNSSSITTKSQSVPLTCRPHVMINTDNQVRKMLDFPCDLFNKPHVKRHWVRGHHPDDSICKCSTCRSKSLRTPVLCTRNSVFCENLFIPNLLGFPKHSENEGLYYWRRKYQNLFLSALSESVFCYHPGQWQNLKPRTRILFKFNHFLVSVNVTTFLTELPTNRSKTSNICCSYQERRLLFTSGMHCGVYGIGLRPCHRK